MKFLDHRNNIVRVGVIPLLVVNLHLSLAEVQHVLQKRKKPKVY
jgi:hypothetical protein